MTIAPNYANAYYRRANANFALARYDKAIADYQAAQESGREDVNVSWNLGWTYYISGKFDQSAATTQEAITIDQKQVALYFNMGVIYLAKGDVEKARKNYEVGIALASKQVSDAKAKKAEPSASLWWVLGTASNDLDSFLLCVATKECRNAPAVETMISSDAASSAGRDLRVRLKNAAVALEYTGKLPAETVKGKIEPLEFAKATLDSTGKPTKLTPIEGNKLRFGLAQEEQGQTQDTSVVRATADTEQIFVQLKYAEMTDGQSLVVKVYRDNQESPWLRTVEDWKLGVSGKAALPLTLGTQFTLAPGEYRVEVYIDAHLVQEGAFKK